MYYNIMGQIARLKAEAEGGKLEFPPEVLAEARSVAVSEQDLFNARAAELQSQLSILRKQSDQRKQELTELKGRLTQLKSSLEYSN